MKSQTSDQSPKVDKDSFIAATQADKITVHNLLLDASCTIIQTDPDFIITGWNESAEKFYHLSHSVGKNVFDLVSISESTPDVIRENLRQYKIWNGTLRSKQNSDTTFKAASSIHSIVNEQGLTTSMIIITDAVNRQTATTQELDETITIYKTLVDTLSEGTMLIGPTGLITACNKRAMDILSLTEEQLLGKIPVSYSWKVFKPDGRVFPDSELPAVVSLQTGFPQKNIPMRIQRSDDTSIWISVSSYALVRKGEFTPYAVVVSFTDISKEQGSR